MDSTQLPACRTFHFAHPASTNREKRDGYTIYDTPSCRASRFGHRLVIEENPTPDELKRYADLWRKEHAGKGIDKAWLVWESRERWDHEPPFGELHKLRCLMADEAMSLVPDWNTARKLERSDIDAMMHLFSSLEGDAGGPDEAHRWYFNGLFDRIEDEWGSYWGDFEDGELRGMAACLFDSREARMQGVITAKAHRGKGICSALIAQCVQEYQDISFGITYVMANDGEQAERIYRRLGFRHVTWVHELGFTP